MTVSNLKDAELKVSRGVYLRRHLYGPPRSRRRVLLAFNSRTCRPVLYLFSTRASYQGILMKNGPWSDSCRCWMRPQVEQISMKHEKEDWKFMKRTVCVLAAVLMLMYSTLGLAQKPTSKSRGNDEVKQRVSE